MRWVAGMAVWGMGVMCLYFLVRVMQSMSGA